MNKEQAFESAFNEILSRTIGDLTMRNAALQARAIVDAQIPPQPPVENRPQPQEKAE